MKLPTGKLGRMVLVVVVFLVCFIPLLYVYQQQSARQDALRKEISTQQSIVKTAQEKRSALEAELKQTEKNMQTAKDSFYRLDSAPDVLDKLLVLAETHDVEVTSTKITTSKKTFTQGKKKAEFQVVSLQLGIRGQVSKFQNFLLGLDGVVPSAELREINLDIAKDQKEQDKGSITINIYCLNGSK